MALVEAGRRDLLHLVPAPALAELPDGPPDGRALRPRVDGLREVVEQLRDEVLIAAEQGRRVQGVAAWVDLRLTHLLAYTNISTFADQFFSLQKLYFFKIAYRKNMSQPEWLRFSSDMHRSE